MEAGSKRRTWRKGQGKRSKARIGRKQKLKPFEQPVLVGDSVDSGNIPASQWSVHVDGWINVSDEKELRLCQISRQDTIGCSPLAITRALIVQQDNLWMLQVNGHCVDPARIPSLSEFSSCLNCDSTTMLLKTVCRLYTCVGNPESKFVELGMSKKNHQFLSSNKEVTAFIDTGFIVTVDDQRYSSTVRSSDCHLLTDSNRCCVCTKYRHNLTAMCSRLAKINRDNKKKLTTNYRFMKTPERLAVLRAAKQTLRLRDQKLARMKKRLEFFTAENGVPLEYEVCEEIETVINERSKEIETLPFTDFKKIFWDQQVAAMKVKGRTGMRWHPLFVRWCLNLSRVSPKAYEVMRESGIQLPTKRTLNDYTHWVSAKPGFSHEVDSFLKSEAKIDEFEESKRFVCLIIDEMKVQEDLVYDKTGNNLLGFVNLGDVNDDLQTLELQLNNNSINPCTRIATHVLTLMVRGIFLKLEFPYANFPTKGVSGHMLYWIMWEAVRRLEAMNLKVIAFVCDGAKPNRKFFKLLGRKEDMKNGIVYKTINRYCRERYIYLISDVPHLIKTTRNCWNSSKFGGTRCMWKNGKYILWDHLRTLYTETQAESGLYIGRRLTYEHVNLTSFSKMKVNLAAQVLSASVSAAFEMMNKNEYQETTKFCLMFDKFFDCLNTRNALEGKKSRKPDLDPYRSINDRRFKWLEETFLGYLDDWNKDVTERTGFTDAERKQMTLSQETLEGLRMTVYSFIEVTKYLLSLKHGLFILSERFNQDPLESFFGQQRARGGRNDNPNIRCFMYNTQAVRVQRTMVIGDGGNVRKRKEQWSKDLDELSRPLRKRPRRAIVSK